MAQDSIKVMMNDDQKSSESDDALSSITSATSTEKEALSITENVLQVSEPSECDIPTLTIDPTHSTNNSSVCNDSSHGIVSDKSDGTSNYVPSSTTKKDNDKKEVISCDSGQKLIHKTIENENPVVDNDRSRNEISHTCDCQKDAEVERHELIKALKYIKELQTQNSKYENEIEEIKLKLNTQEIVFKKAESQIRAEFFSNIEKLSKECNTLRKEKEAIVIRYANSEKEVIMEKKVQQELEKKLKEMSKERENMLSKIKALTSENSRISSSNESKTIEVAKLQKAIDKVNADFHSKEIRIKWLQNKLKTETSSHQETQVKLDHTVHRLNEMKEEAEQVRKDCQEMIKCYQEAEEIKSVKLDGQLKQKVCELEMEKQEKTDQEQIYQLLRQELEALKKKQRMAMEENNSLKLKIHSLEKDRLEYEQKLSKLKDSQNMLKQEVVDLTARLAEMETLQLQLEREKEKSAASLREVERLRSTNAELQADMNACHVKEGELLKFTEGVTDTNVKLQSAHSLLEVKAQALEDDLTEAKRELADMHQKNSELVSKLESAQKQQEDEMQLLARKLAEKTKNVEKLNTRLDEAENENRVLKRRHIASIKELSRELHECKKRLDCHESSNGIRMESSSLGSRSSSTVSLDVVNANERNKGVTSAAAPAFFNGKKETPSSPLNTSSDIPGIDKEMLIERIIKLQKTLARKNDKIDFLEDHIVQLLKEMNKKSKCVDLKTV